MTASNDTVVHALRIADADTSMRHMFIRDLVLHCLIGVHKHEQRQPQRVRINVDLAVREERRSRTDRLKDVVDYEAVADRIRAIVHSGHVNLVETMAEQIANTCLADERVEAARVRVEKLDIFPDATSVGVEIERYRSG